MGWFGLNKEHVWRQLNQEIGAQFVEGRSRREQGAGSRRFLDRNFGSRQFV
jgi:hypothetical protein